MIGNLIACYISDVDSDRFGRGFEPDTNVPDKICVAGKHFVNEKDPETMEGLARILFMVEFPNLGS
jgi:hypothetical protein